MRPLYTITIILFYLFSSALLAQEPSTNFYSLLDSLYQNDSNLNLPDSLKSGATKDIDRMKVIWSPRLSPHGDASIGANAIINYTNQFNSGGSSSADIDGNWRAVGPIGGVGGYKFNGQVNRITFDTQYDGVNNKTIYAGSFFGGLWKSTDDGDSWNVLNTDEQLPQTSVSGIAVGYQSNQNIFICTGEGDSPYYLKTNLGGNSHPLYTTGIYRSKNGGVEWTAINQGFINNFSAGGTCRNILVDPKNDNILYVATTNGIYKSTNALSASPSWSKLSVPIIKSEDFNGLKLHPTNSDIIYAASDEIYKSTDAGLTWTAISSSLGLNLTSLPNNFQVKRIKLEVSPDKPERLYAYITGTDYAHQSTKQTAAHIYYIDDTGVWKPLHYRNSQGNGQNSFPTSWMGFAVSPIDADVVYYGHTKVVGSNDISQINSFATRSGYNSGDFTADVHELVFQPNVSTNPKLFCGHHGGITTKDITNTSTGGWQFKNNGLNLSLTWTFDVSKKNNTRIIYGLQDNGVQQYNEGLAGSHAIGDGYIAQFFGDYKPFGPYAVWNSANSSAGYSIPIDAANVAYDPNQNGDVNSRAWVPKLAQIKEHPGTGEPIFGFNELYSIPSSFTGFSAVIPILNKDSWTIESDFYTGPFSPYHWPGSRRVAEFDIAKSDPNVVYAATFGHDGDGKETNLYRSTTGLKNGTYEWMYPGAPAPNIQFQRVTNLPQVTIAGVTHQPYITGIAINPTNEDQVWLSLSGFNTNKVLTTTDGGITWQGMNTGLPNLPANNIIYQENTNDRLYLATDAGVYVTDASMTSWVRLKGIPNCKVYELRINECSKELFAGTYGRGLWSIDLLPELPSAPAPDLEITSNTTWNTVQRLSQNVLVKAGNKLTITDDVYMPLSGRIKIEPNAILEVDGGRITHECGKEWQGIEVWGSSAHDQLPLSHPQYQGKLILKNGAILENAREAVRVMQVDTWNTFGGLIEAENAIFRNNRRSVEFMQYGFTNHSTFIDCTFELTADHNRRVKDFAAHVTLWDNKGAIFETCHFKDNSGQNQFDLYNGAGIFSIDAAYTVRGNCGKGQFGWCPSLNNVVYSTFENFNIGIHALSSGSKNSIIIDRVKFTDNAIGTQIEGLENLRFTRNVAEIGGLVKSDFNEDFQFGLMTKEATDYDVEENIFTRSGSVMPIAGLKVINSGQYSNKVYRNDFQNLNTGQILEGTNRDYAQVWAGLQSLCNTNGSNSGEDLFVKNDPNADPFIIQFEGIRRDQGNGTKNIAARNSFSSGASNNYRNTTQKPINYHHIAGEQPTTYSAIMVSPNLLTDNGNTCPTNYNPLGWSLVQVQGMIQNYYSDRKDYDNLLYTYHQSIDGGNTDSLLQVIQLTFPTEAQQLRDDLMAEAPYLSTEALMDAANTGILSDALLLEICLANPEATQSEGFLDFVENEIPNPLPANFIQLIYQNWDTETPRTLIEQELGDLHAQLALQSKQILSYYVNDSIDYTDSIHALYASRKNIGEKYRRIELALEAGDFSLSSNLITEIENTYELGEALQPEHDNFKDYATFKEDLANTGKSYLELDDAELNTLRQIAENNTGLSSTLAQSILCFGYAECDNASNSNPLRKRQGRIYSDELLENPLQAHSVSISPNPANEILQIEFQEKGRGLIRLEVFDILGKQVFSRNLKDYKNSLNISHLKNGVYLYKIIQDGKVVQQDKLVVKH